MMEEFVEAAKVFKNVLTAIFHFFFSKRRLDRFVDISKKARL